MLPSVPATTLVHLPLVSLVCLPSDPILTCRSPTWLMVQMLCCSTILVIPVVHVGVTTAPSLYNIRVRLYIILIIVSRLSAPASAWRPSCTTGVLVGSSVLAQSMLLRSCILLS